MLYKCYFDIDRARWVAFQTTRDGEPASELVSAPTKENTLVLLGRHWTTNPDDVALEQ